MRLKAISTAGAVLLLAASARPVQAQASTPADAPAPCSTVQCAIVFDWGSGRTAGTYPTDKKYGSGDDFEAKLRSALASVGIRTKDAPASGELTITVRPSMRPRTTCDAMTGSRPDLTCTAMSDLAVSFAATGGAGKAPPAQRIANRCGGGTNYMPMYQFAQYSAEMIYYTIVGAEKKEKKPIAVC